MQKIDYLRKQLGYARFIHLILIYTLGLLSYVLLTVPHKWWILLTVLVISSGLEPGLMVDRALQRIKGTLLALTLMIPLLYLLQVNYRLIPVIFIGSAVGMVVASLNFRRYDICVFFITLFALLLTGTTFTDLILESPIEMVTNRGICTFIGIAIVLIGDYFLFDAFHYSQKLYLLHQIIVYNLIRNAAQELQTSSMKVSTPYIYMEQLRAQFNHGFTLIADSGKSLRSELQTSPDLKQKITEFQDIIWELRRILFAMSFSALILKSQEVTNEHFKNYQKLISQARKAFIKRR
ncbi:FUSC family protein [Legionella cardiaca]|uniref:FUSC family protein n=1 Tax=Legionella cardiaca TaxID=1071983 RepID=A0ABY8ATS2_9GAMM|nr:FUSC family protein [Legionella cardiaca]WED44087.1 FUSC family protein [Legionella cardiaca]